MKHIINENLLELINNGSLTIERINALVDIKEFIERISSRQYIDEASLNEIVSKYGTKPSILTWGDYFQTEMATSLLNITDEEFMQAVDTVKYDMISSYIIFSEQDSSFFEWVDSLDVMPAAEGLQQEDLEFIHLKILKDYYVDLGVNGNFSEGENAWYWSFKRAAAI